MKPFLRNLSLAALFFFLCFSQAMGDMILDQNFNSASFPGAWSRYTLQGSQNWTLRDAPAYGSTSSSYYMVFDDDALGAATAPNEAALESPVLDASNRNQIFLEYQTYWLAVENTFGYVEVSTDGGTSWTTVQSYESTTVGSESSPVTEVLDITGLAANESDVRLRFRYTDGGLSGKFWYIDDVRVYIEPDAGITELVEPDFLDCGDLYTTTEQVTVRVNNFGPNPISNVPVTVEMEGPTGTTTINDTYAGTIPGNGSVDFTMSSTLDLQVDTVYNFTVYPSFATEGYPLNDTLKTSRQQTTFSYPYIRNFNFSGEGWFATGGNDNNFLTHGTIPESYFPSNPLPDANWTATTQWSTSYGPEDAKPGVGNGWWASSNTYSTSTTPQYLQVDIGEIMEITDLSLSLETDGFFTAKFLIEYSQDGSSWNWYGGSDFASAHEFDYSGNVTGIKTIDFSTIAGNATGQYFRLHPTAGAASNPWPSFNEVDFTSDLATADQDTSWYLQKDGSSSYIDFFLYSPIFDFSSVSNPLVKFDLKMALGGDYRDREVFFQYSTDDGASWSNLGNSNQPLWHDQMLAYGRSNAWGDGTIGDWRSMYHDLCGLAGESCVKFRFHINDARYSDKFALDNFEIHDSIPDVQVSQFLGPVDNGCLFSDPEQVSVRVYNRSCFDVANVPVKAEIDGALTTTLTGTVPNVPAQGFTDYTFPSTIDMEGQGTYDFTTYTDTAQDVFPANDTVKQTINVASVTVDGFPFQEDFNTDEGFWNIMASGDVNNSILHGTIPAGYLGGPEGNGQGWYIEKNGNSNYMDFIIQSPVYDFRELTNPMVTFDLKFSLGGDYRDREIFFQYSLDGGSSWTTVGNNSDPNWTGLRPAYGRSNAWGDGTINTYTNMRHRLCRPSGEECVKFRLLCNDLRYNDKVAFDNFEIKDPLPDDLEAVGIHGPSERNCSSFGSSEAIGVVVQNNTCRPLEDVPVEFNISGPITQTILDTIPGPINRNGSRVYHTLKDSIDMSAPGTYHFEFIVNDNPAGQFLGFIDDSISSNDTLYEIRRNIPVTATTFPYVETFEDTTGFWKQNTFCASCNNYNHFQKDTIPYLGGSEGNGEGWYYIRDGSNNYADGLLESPPFDLSGMTNPIVKFDMKFSLGGDYRDREIFFQYSTDGGSNWSTLGNNSTPQWYGEQLAYGRSNAWGDGTISPYQSFYHNLCDLAGESCVKFRFYANDTRDNDKIAIDNFEIRDSFPDVQVVSFNGPIDDGCLFSEQQTVDLQFYNRSCQDADSVPVVLEVTGSVDTVFYDTVPNIPALGYANMEISGSFDMLNLGQYNFTAYTNAPTDPFPENDSAKNTVFVNSKKYGTEDFDHSEEFDTSNGFWVATNPAGTDNHWTHGTIPESYFPNNPLPDANWTATSQWSTSYGPEDAKPGVGNGWWASSNTYSTSSSPQYLQVDIDEIKEITDLSLSLETAGFFTAKFLIEYSQDGSSWNWYGGSDFASAHEFDYSGNVTGIKTIDLSAIAGNATGQYFRLHPTAGAASNPWPSFNEVDFTSDLATVDQDTSWFVESDGSSDYKDYILTSPVFDFRELTNPMVAFDLKFSLGGDYRDREIFFQYSLDGGSSWTTVGNNSDPNWTGLSPAYGRSNAWGDGTIDTFTNMRHRLCRPSGEECVKFRLWANDLRYGDKVAVDNFRIYDTQGDDLEVVAIWPDRNEGCSGYTSSEQLGLVIENNTCRPLRDIPYTLNISGPTTVTYQDTIPGPISRNSSRIQYTIPTTFDLSAAGTYTLEAIIGDDTTGKYLSFHNDTAAHNDTIREVRVNNMAAVNYFSDFETLPGEFKESSYGYLYTHFKKDSVPYLGGSEGQGDAWYLETNGSSTYADAFLETPPYDFSSVTNPSVFFDMKFSLGGDYRDREIFFQYSTDGGSSWTTLGGSSEPDWYGVALAYGRSNAWGDGTISDYYRFQHELCDLTGEPCVKFRFYCNDLRYSDKIAIDNFEVLKDVVDLQAFEIEQPVFQHCLYSDEQEIRIEVYNASCDPVYNVPVVVELEAPYGDLTFNGSIDSIPGQGYGKHTFSSDFDMTPFGDYNFKIYPDFPTDINRTNDTIFHSLTVEDTTWVDFPQQQTFNTDSGTWKASGSHTGSGNIWAWDTVPDNYLQGPTDHGKSWYVEKDGSSTYMDFFLESSVYDFSDIKNPTLFFDIMFQFGGDYRDRELFFQVSTDGGANWSSLGDNSDPDWYSLSPAYGRSNAWGDGSVNNWTTVMHDLCALTGQSCVKFRLHANDLRYGDKIAFDNFNVTNTPLDVSPTNIEGCWGSEQSIQVDVKNIVRCLTTAPVNIIDGGTPAAPTTHSCSTPDFAFDRDTVGKKWVSDGSVLPVNLEYDYGSGNAQVINQYEVYSNTSAGVGISTDNTGDSRHLSVSDGGIPMGSNWTIETHFKWPLSSTGSWNTFIRGTSYHHIIVRRSDNQLGTYQGGFWGSGFDMSSLSPGWHQVAAVASGGNTDFYIDGTFVGTSSRAPSDNAVSIGNYQGGGQNWGTFDDVRFWNYSRTPAEINADRGGPLTGSETGLTAYYPLEEGTGSSTSQNMAGSSYNLTLTSMDVLNDWVPGIYGGTCLPSGLDHPEAWEFQAWDGSSWITLHDVTSAGLTNNAPGSYFIGNETAYEKYRMHITASQGGSDTIQVTELFLMNTFNLEITELDLFYEIIDSTTITGSQHYDSISIPQNETRTLSLEGITIPSASSKLKIWTQNPNGLQDEIFTNDTIKLGGSAISTGGGSSTKKLSVSDGGIPTGSEYTLEARFKWPLGNPSQGRRTLFRSSDSYGDHHILVNDGSFGSTAGHLGLWNGSFYSTGYDMRNLSPGWHHLASVANGGNTDFYIDGNLVGTAGNVPPSNITTIGNRPGNNPQNWGAFDDVRVWDHARTQSDIQQSMDSTLKGSESGLIAYYTFEEGQGSGGSANLSGSLYQLSLTSMDASTDWIESPFGGVGSKWPNCNDNCSNAISLQFQENNVAQTSKAGTDSTDPQFEDCSGITLENTVWYSLTTSPTGGDVTATFRDQVCNPSDQGIQILIMEISDTLNPCDSASQKQVFCASPGNLDSIVWDTAGLPGNTEYYIMVDGFANNDCDFIVELQGAFTLLPVEIFRFEAYAKDEDAQLEWATAEEQNNQYFVVERSGDGMNFDSIGVIQGGGTTTITQSYEFLDEAPLSGKNYYRLRMVGEEGTFEYSSIEVVDFGNEVPKLTTFPNPAKSGDAVTIVYQGPDNKAFTRVEVFDAVGKEILHKQLLWGENGQSYQLSLPQNLAAGSYLMKFYGKDRVETRKLQVEK